MTLSNQIFRRGSNPGNGRSFKRVQLALAMLTVLSLFNFGLVAETTTAQAADTTPAYNTQAFQDLFADSLFLSTWQRTDYPVADSKAGRSWYWGTKPTANGFFEDYAEAKPYKKRLVQYFDKARMEINNLDNPKVTNGLLVVEMITGKQQLGDSTFDDKGAGAPIPIAGDANNVWPTYASLSRAYNVPIGLQPGARVQTAFNPPDQPGNQVTTYAKDAKTEIVTVQNNLGIPEAFWEFLNRKGQVYNNGTYSEAVISDWLFSTGLPVTEAYWTKVKLAGKEVDVMFQAFERRLLTYTPSNPPAFQVEMGNVGAHYVRWRYNDKLPAYVNPAAPQFSGKLAEWYEITSDVLNVRTGPGTSYDNPPRTENRPYLTTLYKGNHIQPIKEVKGEKLVGNNDVWYQIYEDPNLFVYSGYTKKMTLPDFPTPPREHSGIWISVSLTKQMMAVYDGKKMIYKTLIASGVPNDDDPTKDFRTPKGVFKIDGSYRPKSQTMEGDESSKASGSYYKIEQVRNVSYFYQDYSIHGTYWHARFGTFPQSHGCVNATVYDAGLMYQLRAGTIVDVF